MFKSKVIKHFRDKDSDKVFEVGDVFEGNAKRIKHLQRLGYLGEEVEKVEKPKKKEIEGE